MNKQNSGVEFRGCLHSTAFQLKTENYAFLPFVYMTVAFWQPENANEKQYHYCLSLIFENSDVTRILCSVQSVGMCMCAAMQCFLQSDFATYWPGMNNSAFF